MKSLKNLITQTFCSSVGKHDLKLQYILGCWLSKTTNRNKTHRFQYSPSLNELFISESNIIQRWYVSNLDLNSITCIADSSDTCQAFPLDFIPVEKKKNYCSNTLEKNQIQSMVIEINICNDVYSYRTMGFVL